jgi:hypothetical protein
MAFPQDDTLLDDFNRADGTAQSGAGATVWTANSLGGAGGGWNVSSSKFVPGSGGANHLSVDDVHPADFEAIFDCPGVDTGSAYFAWFFCVQDGAGAWAAYWLFYQGSVGWEVKKHVGGSTSSVGDVGIADAPALSAGDKIGLHRVADAIKVYACRGGVWDAAPLLDLVDGDIQDAGAFAVEAAGGFQLDNLRAYAATADGGDDGGGGDGPTEAVTIYVDADHGAASDAHTRLEASDPDTPLKSIQQAGMLAYATVDWADTIQVEPAANADPENELDTSVYAGLTHRMLPTGDVLPFGDNSGNVAITLQGHVVDGVMPKVAKINGTTLRNWVVQDFQQGYDVGSGDDCLTIGTLIDTSDLVFRRVLYTGGGYDIRVWADLLWDDCTVRSPLSPFQGSGNRNLDGAGFHVAYINNNNGEEGVGKIEFRDCVFDTIQGEDGIQASLGGVGGIYEDGWLVVDGCTFINVVGAGGFHTDSIQILGGQKFEIRNCVFFNCDDCVAASDFHNHEVTIENCLSAYCGDPFWGQGSDVLTFRHNTVIKSFFGTGLSWGGFRQDPDGSWPGTLFTVVNNIVEDYNIQQRLDESDISHNIVLRLPGAEGNLAGVSEFGTSDRMDDLPAFTSSWAGTPAPNYELANTPVLSPGIGQGVATDLTVDRLGRTRSDPPDVGCHESDPDVAVLVAARAPYVMGRTPPASASGVAPTSNVTLTLNAKPGETIDPASVTTATFYVTDPAGQHLPVVAVTVSAPDGDRNQVITLDIDGVLYPYVTYSVTAAATIADTEGSTIVNPVSWSFRIVGPDGPAVYPDDGDEDASAAQVVVRRPDLFPNGTVLGLYRAVLPTAAAEPRTPRLAIATVTNDVATFSGLPTGARWEMAAEVGGQWRRVFSSTREVDEGKTAAENRVAWRWPRGEVPEDPDSA